MIKIGQKVRFKPFADMFFGNSKVTNETTEGTVIYINRAHRWFMVSYGDENNLRVGLNFNDIGHRCTIL